MTTQETTAPADAPTVRVWFWNDCALWAGYSFAETLAAARKQDGAECYDDASEDDEILPIGFERIQVRVNSDDEPKRIVTLAEAIAEHVAAGVTFPHCMGDEE